VKAGPALLQLTGASTHTGTTTITNGTLQVDGALGPSSVSVQNGGRLAGTGAINGLVTVQSGGALAPGDAGVGMLTVNNSMTLAGQTIMDLSKNGSTLTSDQVVGISSLTYGGSLVVTNRGPGTPAAGDSVILFSAGGYSGSFATVTLPSPVPGLSWDLSNLVVNGSITLVGATNGPIITSQPQSLAIGSGAPASFGVIAAGPRPLAYQWRKNGSNIISATTTTYNIGAAGSNDIAGYSVVVTNSYGSATSIIASLNFFAPGQSAVTNSLVVYLSFDNTLAAQAPRRRRAGCPSACRGRPARYSPSAG
jgi:autotransporter-associated beta strand protein